MITIDSKIWIDDPSKEVMDYVNHNLVIPNPEYANKQRMGFWMGNTPKHLYLYEKIGNQLAIPYGCISEIGSIVQEPIIPMFTEHPKLDIKCDVPLYDYQEEAVQKMYDARYGILQAPAGSGKTQMGIALMGKFGKRALWITHTKDLLKQSYDRAKQYIDEKLLGTITEGCVDIGGFITFATVQTLSNINLAMYKDFWDVIIVDECHRVAGSPTTMTMYFRCLSQLSARHKYGLSATLHRADNLIKCTYSLIGGVKWVVPEEAVGDRICKVGICTRYTGIKVNDDMLNDDGTLNYTNLINALAGQPLRNSLLFRDIVANQNCSCLILSHRVNHLQELIEMLPKDMQSQARFVNGKMTSKSAKAEREQAIEDMRTGKAKYLFATYSLAKEGLDIPCLERLFMATPVKDYSVVIQSVGRIARVCEGKRDPVVYDYVDNIGYLQKAYKTRCKHYKTIECYEVNG